jgi:hypothetical protein
LLAALIETSRIIGPQPPRDQIFPRLHGRD